MSEHASNAQGLNPEVLALLVCPVDKSELELEGNELICTDCGRHYPIENGIPNMLVEDVEE
jgi:uncharacterized protein YbaR (Trm112 family)